MESKADGSCGFATLGGNFLDARAAQLLFQQPSVVGPADLEDPSHIYGRNIDVRVRVEFWEGLVCHLASENITVEIQSNRIYPRQDKAFVAKLFEPFPTSAPSALRHLSGSF
jgi:hypothetical protein